ncbi:hypothetical protein RRG08_060005 [Elysia crispata]|uniref:Uncharacterized protein n=1 Tax=Elysia crispata TaxID=231223 RepID=A0AAE0YER0_9GAST|nr:hypothetical protein RRG08_060005 [Elysia crispata]
MEEKEALHEKELRDVGRKEKKWERERIEEDGKDKEKLCDLSTHTRRTKTGSVRAHKAHGFKYDCPAYTHCGMGLVSVAFHPPFELKGYFSSGQVSIEQSTHTAWGSGDHFAISQ